MVVGTTTTYRRLQNDTSPGLQVSGQARDGKMDNQDKHRFVRQYVERQKPYLPTYTTEYVLNERRGTPSKPLRSGEFGFDTPVLRSRVPESKISRSQLAPQAGRSKPRTHEAELAILPKRGPSPSPGEAPSETQDAALGKKDKPRSKRKKASTPVDTDNERAARRLLTLTRFPQSLWMTWR